MPFFPDAYIMADGGWRSDKVLKSVYRHAMNDRKKEMSDSMYRSDVSVFGAFRCHFLSVPSTRE